MSALDIRGLSKTFSGHVVPNGVDLTVKAGEVHAVVGQNGSGKSTPIKILDGYHSPDRGATASVLGRELERSEEHTSELQSLMRNPYALFCLTKKVICKNIKHHVNKRK